MRNSHHRYRTNDRPYQATGQCPGDRTVVYLETFLCREVFLESFESAGRQCRRDPPHGALEYAKCVGDTSGPTDWYALCRVPGRGVSLFGRSSWQKKVFNLLIGYRIVREASGHIAVSPDEIPVYECYGVEQSKITVIPNGINETDFAEYGANQFADRFGLRAAPFILFMGRLNPIKGPDLLLEAFCTIAHKHPERDLVFAGPDGGLLGALEKVTRARGVADRVSFIGYVAGRDKAEAYRAADLLVIPSRQEAMSIVVLEAGIVGTPVLLTDRCGFDEVAKVGGGKVVAATAIDLAAGLDSLLADRSALKGMGEHLQAHVRENFTWDVIVRRFMDLYQQLLARPGRGHAINQ